MVTSKFAMGVLAILSFKRMTFSCVSTKWQHLYFYIITISFFLKNVNYKGFKIASLVQKSRQNKFFVIVYILFQR